MPAVMDRLPKGEKETGWVNRLFNRDGYTPEYQELKFTLHRKLLDRINLEALSSMAGERVRAEIRSAVAKLVEEEKTPLSLVEKDRVIEEILDEVFGLGPLEPLLQDPTVSDILVTTPKLVYVERGGKLYRTPVEFKDDAHLLRIIRLRWSMPACLTARASTLRFLRLRWMGPCSRFADSGVTA
jgi:pilus assembly protein CpaF